MSSNWKNRLFYGDNLHILREHVQDESVDLIYLDPPFNSSANYNVLFNEKSGEQSAAQITAFEDTWHWTQESEATFHETVTSAPERLVKVLEAFRGFLGTSDMMAYLTMMAPRLMELHRVLKPTGSIYLHCDPTASHYLKLLIDAIFGALNFKNEVIWKRTTAHSSAKRWGDVHDVILFYTKSNAYTWNPVFQTYDESYLKTKYRHEDSRGSYRLSDLTGDGLRQGDSGKPWRGFDPSAIGRHWAVPKNLVAELAGQQDTGQMTSQEKLDLLEANDFIYMTPKGKSGGVGFPQWKRHLGGGVPITSVISDIPPINAMAKERLGYPTQKPEALLERIINASSSEGDIVLDPFCGCGTTINVAERLHRRWIGIDITHLAIGLIRGRLHDSFGSELAPYEVVGEPKDASSAEALALHDRYQFQWWAVGLVGGRPAQDKKKGKDTGIDGNIYFFDDTSGKSKRIIIQVKSGHVKSPDIRDLKGVLDREKAEIGAFITLKPATKDMLKEAISAGFYESAYGKFPKMQILTIEEILDGKKLQYPYIGTATFKRAERQSKSKTQQHGLFAAPQQPPAHQTPLPERDFSTTPLLDKDGEDDSA